MDMGFNITIISTSDMSVLLLKEPLLVPGYTPLLLRSKYYSEKQKRMSVAKNH
jgi:hypothetical protein